MTESVKEVSLKVKKLGIVHYYGLTYPEGATIESEVCEDCGATATQFTKVVGGKRDDKNKPVWKIVCNKCVEAYKSEDLGEPIIIKLGDYNKFPISRIEMPYKPCLRTCTNCKAGIDLYKHSMYIYKEETYCVKCLKEIHGMDYTAEDVYRQDTPAPKCISV
jgi:hypothetical protein